MEEGGSYKLWEEWGDGLVSWARVFLDVVCGEAFVWVGRILINILALRFGWGIE